MFGLKEFETAFLQHHSLSKVPSESIQLNMAWTVWNRLYNISQIFTKAFKYTGIVTEYKKLKSVKGTSMYLLYTYTCIKLYTHIYINIHNYVVNNFIITSSLFSVGLVTLDTQRSWCPLVVTELSQILTSENPLGLKS